MDFLRKLSDTFVWVPRKCTPRDGVLKHGCVVRTADQEGTAFERMTCDWQGRACPTGEASGRRASAAPREGVKPETGI